MPWLAAEGLLAHALLTRKLPTHALPATATLSRAGTAPPPLIP